jgi:hypothetical protein
MLIMLQDLVFAGVGGWLIVIHLIALDYELTSDWLL